MTARRLDSALYLMVPKAFSTNERAHPHLRTTKGGKKFIGVGHSSAYRKWLTETTALFISQARAQGQTAPHEGDAAVTIVIGKNDCRMDCDNLFKAALDAVEAAGIVKDDKQFRRVEAFYGNQEETCIAIDFAISDKTKGMGAFIATKASEATRR